ncbi:MAG: mevalonate kinase, partial [Holosporales bacterium]|nr:mevalonate kinase [Holosporales bacterium]
MMLHAYACGKLILIGEHAVVYGYPALALPLPSLTVEVTIGGPQEKAVDLSQEEGEKILKAFAQCRALFAQDQPEIREKPLPPLNFRASLPLGKGLGGSAAISVALVRLCIQLFHKALERHEIVAYAHQLETLFHHTPSGVDVEAILSLGPILFQKGQPVRPLPPCPEGWIVMVATPEHTPTSVMVDRLHQHLEKAPQEHRHLQALGNLVSSAARALETQDLPLLGSYLTQAHHHLQALNVSTPTLDKVTDALCAQGALGAKMTGGGGGGV